ncbi:protein DESIGUAL 2-like [Rutidosis leptorrhynchoides]|uniref:protein DESIGUAL 2-like n=1 Tax=Rutidosis leptorrhynchoides TaxID=125765 RepID=UPI003A994B17
MALNSQTYSQNAGQYVVQLVCLLIIAMDLTAGILGIQAEIAQNKVQNLRMFIFECRDPSYQAFKLGFIAAVLLAFAHAIANLFGGCHFVSSKPELDHATSNKQFAMASLILSWITLIIGFGLLIAGVMANSSSRKSCGVSNHRYLSIGGIACFIHGMFAVSYYISATAVEKEEKKLHPHGPMMNPHGPMMMPHGPMMNPHGPMMNPPGPMMNPPGPVHQPAPSAPV